MRRKLRTRREKSRASAERGLRRSLNGKFSMSGAKSLIREPARQNSSLAQAVLHTSSAHPKRKSARIFFYYCDKTTRGQLLHGDNIRWCTPFKCRDDVFCGNPRHRATSFLCC